MNNLLKSNVTLGYEEPKGNLYLREKISEYLKEHGVYVSPDSILIVSGAIQAATYFYGASFERGINLIRETILFIFA